MTRIIGIIGFLLISGSCKAQTVYNFNYPETKTTPKTSLYHDTSITDNYAWLDSVNEPEVVKWTQLQDSTMKAFTRSLPEYGKLREKVASLMSFTGRATLPVEAGGKLFIKRENEEGNWGLYIVEGVEGEERNLNLPFDSRAAFFVKPSPDAQKVALGIAVGGGYFDWKILDVETGELSKETYQGTDLGNSRLAWRKKSEGFYYVGKKSVSEGGQRSGLRVYYHSVDGSQQEDKVVYTPASDGSKLHLSVSDDNKNLIIVEREGASTAGNVILVNTMGPFAVPMRLTKSASASYIYLGNNNSEYFFQTDLGAPKGKIVSVDIGKKTKIWKDRIPEGNESMMGFQSAGGTLLPLIAGDHFIIPYQEDLKINLKKYSLNGEKQSAIELPTGGLYFNQNGLNALSGNRESPTIFLQFIGIKEPNTVFKLDVITGNIRAFIRAKTTFNAENYISEIAFAESNDGTKIPISLTYKKGIKRNGENPFMMQVYGAIAFTNYPYFQGDYITWLEMGGIHAVAHIRGGGAYGSKWHQDGIARNKQKGVDDYIATIEWAIKEKYTSEDLIVLNGVSAGTIPVGAVLTQRPDLIGAVISHYGMLDMIGYESKLSEDANHGYMIPEIGRASNEEDFKALISYSPYQKIEQDRSYPPVLALTSEMDSPLNADSYKFIARLQSGTQSSAPMLLQMAWGSGHSGFGSQQHSAVDTYTDEIAFLIKVLQIDASEFLMTK